MQISECFTFIPFFLHYHVERRNSTPTTSEYIIFMSECTKIPPTGDCALLVEGNGVKCRAFETHYKKLRFFKKPKKP